MHYYTFNIADYRKDTGHLSTLEHGIYRQLLDWYYLEEVPIPKETQTVIRRLRLGSESDIRALQNVLDDFFVLQDDGHHQLRCDDQIDRYHEKAEVNKVNGKLGGRPKKTQSVIFGNPNESETKGNQEPITNNHKPITIKKNTVAPPIGVTDSVWQDWVKLRKEKRAAVTQTAITGIEREARKAGVSLQVALETCCERGWTGFKADWLKDKSLSKTGQTNQTVMSGLTRGLVGGGKNVNLLGN